MITPTTDFSFKYHHCVGNAVEHSNTAIISLFLNNLEGVPLHKFIVPLVVASAKRNKISLIKPALFVASYETLESLYSYLRYHYYNEVPEVTCLIKEEMNNRNEAAS